MTYGIDLGTTHSCIAHIDETGRPAVIRSALAEDTTPSAVYFESPRDVLVGRAAKDAARISPELVARLVKRDMGTDAAYTYHGERHTPETISALILRELTRVAAEQTGEQVRDVVITVPAHFGVAGREATRHAGRIAGLNVLDVLAEPVAAALHCQAILDRTVLDTTGPGAYDILVYDLGGGTFDTTVIRFAGDDVTVVCTDGDHALGGADWDQALCDHLLKRFAAEHPGLDPYGDPAFTQDLLISVEQLRKDLSTAQARRYVMRFAGAVTRVELARTELEELTAGLLDRTIAITERTIATARAKGVTRLDAVLLAGGMTRMPAVARAVEELLGLPARTYEPELAVAKGAALFALQKAARPAGDGPPGQGTEATASGSGTAEPEAERFARKRVATVAPRAFGVQCVDSTDPLASTDPLRARKIVLHLIPANTPLPADTGPFSFLTLIDNQRTVMVEVFEQSGPVESGDMADNRKIGQGLLRLPPRLPVGSPIEVTFVMSETGELSVAAVEPASRTDVRFDLQIGDLDEAALRTARTSVGHYDVSG